MKKVLFVFICVSLFAIQPSSVFADNPLKRCVEFNEIVGDNCNSKESVRLDIKNKCSQDVCIQVCFQQTNGKWNCLSDSKLRVDDKLSWFTCRATGRYLWNLTVSGEEDCHWKQENQQY